MPEAISIFQPIPEASIAIVEEGLMTIQEAVAFSRVARSNLYALMERGDLPYCKVGRRRLIPKKALVEMMARSLVAR